MLVSALIALALSSQPDAAPFMRYADIHGDTVVFTSEGDLWLGDLASGKARRLTSDPGAEIFPRFSPDGKQIAFMGEYDGVREVEGRIRGARGNVHHAVTAIERLIG